VARILKVVVVARFPVENVSVPPFPFWEAPTLVVPIRNRYRAPTSEFVTKKEVEVLTQMESLEG
jgi:hypothetical protein